MHVTTLLTNPAAPGLDPALVDSLRNAWGGGAVSWLAPDEAAEFSIPDLPENRWQVWEELQQAGVDMVIQPAVGRQKKLLLADMDSTMIGQECIDELAAEAGVRDRVAEITARAMNGELDFEAALQARVSLLQGLNYAVIEKVLNERITLTPGGRTLVATMKAHGARCVLVSGGFVDFTRRVAADLGFDEHRANALCVENGKLTGEVQKPILGREAKVRALHELVDRLDIVPAQVIAVGDGANDLGMLSVAGTGVALHAKPSVAEKCDIRINHGDLTALLYLQGYDRDAFVCAGQALT